MERRIVSSDCGSRQGDWEETDIGGFGNRVLGFLCLDSRSNTRMERTLVYMIVADRQTDRPTDREIERVNE